MLIFKYDRMKGNTKTVGICVIANIRLTSVPEYIFLPVIHILDITPVGSYNSSNKRYNSLALILRHAYLLDGNLCNTLRKSVGYFPKIIAWYLTHVIPIILILEIYLRWAVRCGYSLSILPLVDTICVSTSADTAGFILGLLYIHKTSDICCNHRLVFNFYPNCNLFPIVVECLHDLLIDGVFPAISLLHITPCPTGKLCTLFIGE